MNSIRKMCNMIRLEALGKGMITGAAVSVLSIAFLMFSGYDLDSAAPVIMAISFAAAGALVGFLMSIRRTTALFARFKSLEKVSGPLGDDSVRMVSDDLALGRKWLIWKKGTYFKAWTADMLREVTLEANNPAASKGVLILQTNDGRTEKCVVTKSAALNEWIVNFKEFKASIM